MLDQIPGEKELLTLLGAQRYQVWTELCALIEQRYCMERLWDSGGKAWKYAYKYRRGGKTLCALYAKESTIGFLVILGKAEREKFELERDHYTIPVQKIYEESKTYHDGKWMMIPLEDASLFEDLLRLLALKRRPNRT